VSIADAPLTTLAGFAAMATVGAGTTVTVTVTACDPPGPVQFSVKLVVLPSAAVVALPLVNCIPLQPPDAAQLLAFVALQLSVVVAPLAIAVGLAVKVTVGGGGAAVTLTSTDWP